MPGALDQSWSTKMLEDLAIVWPSEYSLRG
jgi:hypothetical protein